MHQYRQPWHPACDFSTSLQVMGYCLMTPSQYLNHCCQLGSWENRNDFAIFFPGQLSSGLGWSWPSQFDAHGEVAVATVGVEAITAQQQGDQADVRAVHGLQGHPCWAAVPCRILKQVLKQSQTFMLKGIQAIWNLKWHINAQYHRLLLGPYFKIQSINQYFREYFCLERGI